MPSPFPGMDPSVEDQEWTDFHVRFITVVGEVLTSAVRHRYVVRVERRVYVERYSGEADWTYLVIRARRTNDVVTILEVLSPTNKSRGSDGFREYAEKRDTVLQSSAHLVEIDLLRRGERPPVIGAVPETDYRALICRRDRRPRADVYGWTLRDRLPTLPVPLSEGDAEVDLDLQRAFTTTYERAAYEDSIDYGAKLRPPVGGEDAAWVETILGSRS